MSVPIRTLTRVFLLVGGVVYAASAALEGTMLKVAFGLFAAALGGFGLAWTYREAATDE